MEPIDYFEITAQGEAIALDTKQFSGGFNGEEDKVYIVVHNDARVIFLWKGVKAGVRQKFVGSRATGDQRKEYGYHYKIVVMDADDEDKKFIELIRGGEASGGGSRNESFDAFGESSEEQFTSYSEMAEKQGIKVEDSEVAAITGESSNRGAPAHIAKMGGIGIRPQKSFLSDPNFFDDVKEDKQTREKVTSVLQDVNKVDALEIVNALDSPKGFDREMIIIGQTVYRVDFDANDQVILKDLENPLDGVIMVSQYVPRILAENGKIKAVELLKQTSDDIQVDDSMTQDLADLTAMFQIEIE